MSKLSPLLSALFKEYPAPRIELQYRNNFELLAAVILSAQCTDKRVNIVTGNLFKKYRTIADYANADPSELERDIRSTGFFRNKAKNIIGSARIILEKFGGKVPKTMEEILTLPGVARKTANIVLGNAYGVLEGIAVDTHVIRLSSRLGLSKNTNPGKIEKDLMGLVPRNKWLKISLVLQAHGRKFCTARKPRHDTCPVRRLCPQRQ